MPRQRRRRLLLGTLIVLAVPVLVWWAWVSYWSRRLDETLASLRAKGLATSIEALLGDPPADDENAALAYLEAIGLAETADASQQFIRLWHDPETAHDARALLPSQRAAIDTFQRATELPRSRYPVDYDAGLDVVNPHLFQLAGWSQLLLAEADVEAESGDIDLALGRLRSFFACCRSLREEPTSLGQSVRISMISSGLHAMKRVLPRCDSARAAIEAVRVDDARGAFETAMRGELILLLKWRDAQMRSKFFEGDRVGPGALEEWLFDKGYTLGHPAIQGLLQPFFDSQVDLSMGYGARFVESGRLPLPERFEEVAALERELETEGKTLAGSLVTPVLGTLHREARLTSSIRLMWLAAALLDLRRERGILPEDWSAEIDSRLLIDPRTGRAFHWERTQDSLILRIDGEDENPRDWEIALRD